jgi:prepilin-type N-terminal cleavage/methylation domain-containing protein
MGHRHGELMSKLRSKSRGGFTLVELLVVIAIISVLAALLLPAVQQAREAARRSSCVNNMKQLAVAMHNYHDQWSAFPIGAMHSQTLGMPRSLDRGSSFFVALLPFIEQASLFNELNDAAAGGVGNTDISNNINGPVFNGRRLAVLSCPSSPLPQLTDPLATTPLGVMMPTYVGISGAATVSGGPNPDAEPTYKGVMASSGILVPNRSVNFADVSDGSTNTIMLGEQSAFARDNAGNSIDLRSSNSHGAWVGSTGSGTPGDGAWFCTNFQSWNITTLRYTINFLDATAAQAGGASGVGPEDGANRPIQSIHTGGANVALTDGSIRFVGESIDYTVLTNLANRNDGNEISDF